MKDKKKVLLTNIYYENQLGKQEKLVAKAIQKLQQLSTRSIYFMEWSENDGLLLFRSKVYVSVILDLCCCIVFLHYNLRITKY